MFIIRYSLFDIPPDSLTFAVLSQTTGVVTCGEKLVVAGYWSPISTEELNDIAANN